jgi:predicted Abi (CAAX) family protease
MSKNFAKFESAKVLDTIIRIRPFLARHRNRANLVKLRPIAAIISNPVIVNAVLLYVMIVSCIVVRYLQRVIDSLVTCKKFRDWKACRFARS